MANALYDTGRNAFLQGAINWTSDNIKAIAIDTTKYAANLATDQFLSLISGVSGAIVATSPNLSGMAASAGVANASPVTFSSVTGAVCALVVLYKDTGTASTSQLIAYIDTAIGLPFTPNGGNQTVGWDTGPNKIFKL